MSIFEPTLTSRQARYPSRERNIPSFSSILLDKIYRSIDEGDARPDHSRFPMPNKQSLKCHRAKPMEEEEHVQQQTVGSRRDFLVQKCRQNRILRKEMDDRKEIFAEFQRRLRHDQDHDQDFLCFSSTSSSSDSSCGRFSSSDSESVHGTISKVSSCFVPPKPKPIKTNMSEKTKKSEKKQGKTHAFEESLIKSKARAMKIYSNLKKVGPPVSPGARLASFINSLFTTGNSPRKPSSNSSRSVASCDNERKFKSGQASTCSSASSYSRSCLSKQSPSTRERLRNGVKRTVRFCPVSVIVDEGSRPCGHKRLYGDQEEEQQRRPMRGDEEGKSQATQMSRRVEEMAREFLKEYHKNNRKSMEEDDDEDDALSCSSSDLFELDHLSVIKNDRYREELPVYETTRLDQNRAIF